MQLKLSKTRWVEAVLMIPVTAMLGPSLPFGIVITTFTLVLGVAVGLLGGRSALIKELHSSSEVAEILLMMLAATAGLCSLWVNILFGRDWTFVRVQRRYALAAALIAGLAAAGYWIVRLHPQDSSEWKAFWVWVGMILAPGAIAIRYLWTLLIPNRAE